MYPRFKRMVCYRFPHSKCYHKGGFTKRSRKRIGNHYVLTDRDLCPCVLDFQPRPWLHSTPQNRSSLLLTTSSCRSPYAKYSCLFIKDTIMRSYVIQNKSWRHPLLSTSYKIESKSMLSAVKSSSTFPALRNEIFFS